MRGIERASGELTWLCQGFWWRLKLSWRWWLAILICLTIFVSVDGDLAPVWIAAVICAGLIVWARFSPGTYWRFVSGPLWRRRMVRSVEASWPQLLRNCGLYVRVVNQDGKETRQVPWLRKVRWKGGELRLLPALLVGQTVDDFEAALERMRQSVQARRIRIETEPVFAIVFSFDDPLGAAFDARLPNGALQGSLERLELGRTESGSTWLLNARRHTLVAGSTGAGKGSLLWGLMLSLAPSISLGSVQVHGIDLKGGMELSMGAGLFARYARSSEEAVVLLEDAVAAMGDRSQRLAGHTRQHEATISDPHVIVVIDEIAAITAYLNNRDLKKRIADALALLCSQGRAVGYSVFACLQDPRKETIPMRGLFTQMIGLRLKDREETSMVLGDGAIEAGALCHKIPFSAPGTGYLMSSEGGAPLRVRAGMVSDEMIRYTAHNFPAAVSIPIVLPSKENAAKSGAKAAERSGKGGRPRRRRNSRSQPSGEASEAK